MNKPTRILTAIIGALALGCMFAYRDIQKYGSDFQAHPMLPVVILTDFFGASLSVMFFYFISRWLGRRKERKLGKAGDDKFYEEVARELQEKPMVPGLWTKAFAEMGGDDAKARALYIKYRVTQLAEASRQKLEKNRFTTPQEEKSKRIRNIFVVFAMFVFSAAILTAIFDASPVTPTEHEAYDFIETQKTFANWGDANAAYSLGSHYDRGLDVQVDKVEAYKWYSIAVALGSENARNNLTKIKSQMTPEQIATAKQNAADFVPRKQK